MFPDNPLIEVMEKYGTLSYNKIVFCCDWCGNEIYEDEEYYEIDNKNVCRYCIEDCKKTAWF